MALLPAYRDSEMYDIFCFCFFCFVLLEVTFDFANLDFFCLATLNSDKHRNPAGFYFNIVFLFLSLSFPCSIYLKSKLLFQFQSFQLLRVRDATSHISTGFLFLYSLFTCFCLSFIFSHFTFPLPDNFRMQNSPLLPLRKKQLRSHHTFGLTTAWSPFSVGDHCFGCQSNLQQVSTCIIQRLVAGKFLHKMNGVETLTMSIQRVSDFKIEKADGFALCNEIYQSMHIY